jgi:hypothetical protein
LWEWYRRAVGSGAHWFREAVFRLGESYEEVTDEHRAVDLVIALECCVGTRKVEKASTKGERVLDFVTDEGTEDEVGQGKLKDLGDLRDEIVHGSYLLSGKDQWDAERVASCLSWGEECVRRCLRKAAALFSQDINLKEEIGKGVSVKSLRAKADACGAF